MGEVEKTRHSDNVSRRTEKETVTGLNTLNIDRRTSFVGPPIFMATNDRLRLRIMVDVSSINWP